MPSDLTERTVEHCWVSECRAPGERRFLAKPIGTYSIAGAWPKVAAIAVHLCHTHRDAIAALPPEQYAATIRNLEAAYAKAHTEGTN